MISGAKKLDIMRFIVGRFIALSHEMEFFLSAFDF